MENIKVKTPTGKVVNCPKADEAFFVAKDGFDVLTDVKPIKRKSKNKKHI